MCPRVLNKSMPSIKYPFQFILSPFQENKSVRCHVYLQYFYVWQMRVYQNIHTDIYNSHRSVTSISNRKIILDLPTDV